MHVPTKLQQTDRKELSESILLGGQGSGESGGGALTDRGAAYSWELPSLLTHLLQSQGRKNFCPTGESMRGMGQASPWVPGHSVPPSVSTPWHVLI